MCEQEHAKCRYINIQRRLAYPNSSTTLILSWQFDIS